MISLAQKTEKRVITDAGHTTLTYDQARTVFTDKELRDWIDKLTFQNDSFDDDLATAEGIIDINGNFLTIPVIVAKAVYGKTALIKAVCLNPYSIFLSEYELEAIKLGDVLRKNLGLGEDTQIINDNKEAVRTAKINIVNVKWQRRCGTTMAHKLEYSDGLKLLR